MVHADRYAMFLQYILLPKELQGNVVKIYPLFKSNGIFVVDFFKFNIIANKIQQQACKKTMLHPNIHANDASS